MACNWSIFYDSLHLLLPFFFLTLMLINIVFYCQEFVFAVFIILQQIHTNSLKMPNYYCLLLFLYRMEKTWSDDCTTRQPQVSVTNFRIRVNSQGWMGTNELLPGSWAIRNQLETWGCIACCLQDDIRCLKHIQTFPHLGSNIRWNRRAQPLEIVCATEMFDLKESLIMRVTGLFGQLWWMIVPVRARVQAIGKVVFRKREHEERGRWDWDDPWVAWQNMSKKQKVIFTCQQVIKI